MKALLLAAGEGQRLRPLTDVLPKALIPVLNIPLIEFGLAALVDAGADEVIVNAHSLATKLSRFAKDYKGAARVESVVEKQLLGTGGALRNVASQLAQERFLIANADVLHAVDLGKVLKAHLAGPVPVATLALRSQGWESHGGFWCDESAAIRGYLAPGEKPPPGGRPGLFTGLHVLEPAILAELPPEKTFCIVQNVYRPLLERAAPLRGLFVDEAPWEDMGTPARYLNSTLNLLASLSSEGALPARARALLGGRGYVERSGGIWAPPAWTGSPQVEGPSLLGEGAALKRAGKAGPLAVMGEGSVASQGAHLERCILWERARAPKGQWKECIFFQNGQSLPVTQPDA